jgi:hypothetical protein
MTRHPPEGADRRPAAPSPDRRTSHDHCSPYPAGGRPPGRRAVPDRHRLAGQQAQLQLRPALRPPQHLARRAARQQRRRGRGGQRLRDPPAPRHGDRHLGPARLAGAPGLHRPQRRHPPRPGPEDERGHRHPAQREERRLPPRARPGAGARALRADVGAARRGRPHPRLRAAGDRPRAARRRSRPGRVRHAQARRRLRHPDQEPGRRAARRPAAARPQRRAA